MYTARAYIKTAFNISTEYPNVEYAYTSHLANDATPYPPYDVYYAYQISEEDKTHLTLKYGAIFLPFTDLDLM